MRLATQLIHKANFKTVFYQFDLIYCFVFTIHLEQSFGNLWILARVQESCLCDMCTYRITEGRTPHFNI